MNLVSKSSGKLIFNIVLLGAFSSLSTESLAQQAAEAASEESQLEENSPNPNPNDDPKSEVEPAEASSQLEGEATEGATSFSNLCGNGQGKPEENEVRKKRKGIFGLADRAAAMTRKIPVIGDMMVDTANSLSQSLACRLYPEEQKQAAEATEQATQSEEVGKTVEWQSSVRKNVSGSSTVSAKNTLANGTPCLTITDVAIVDGDEIRVSKKMCKLPGTHRYTIVNA